MSEEKIAALEARLAKLEKRMNVDLWVTNTTFWKRTLGIYGHSALAQVVFGFCILGFTLMVFIIGMLAR